MSQETLSVLSFNVLGIPFFTKNYASRLKKLVQEIAKLDPDVVCFQEVWLAATKNYLQKSLRPLGFQYFFRPTAGWRLSGLLIFSKHQIIERQSYFFSPTWEGVKLSLLQFLVAKGYCFVKIKLAGQKIIIFNIHLRVDWRYNIDYQAGLSLSKFEELGQLVEIINSLKNEKIILAGDFNFEVASQVYRKFLQLAGLANPFAKLAPRTILGNLYRFTMVKPGKQRDFIFTKNFAAAAVIQTKALWSKPFAGVGCLSDHAGLLVKLKA